MTTLPSWIADWWKPIETAPTGDDDFYLVCGEADERNPFVVRGSILKNARSERTPEHLSLNWITHWMPLPPRPRVDPVKSEN